MLCRAQIQSTGAGFYLQLFTISFPVIGKLVNDGKLNAGEVLRCVFLQETSGNILAAWYAKQMGTPLGKLFCACNENRVLTDFINTGEYSISDREFVLTPSPSMDILISSNMERQLFELTGATAILFLNG